MEWHLSLVVVLYVSEKLSFCMFWLKKNEKQRDNVFLADMAMCFFAVPWAGLITGRDSVTLAAVAVFIFHTRPCIQQLQAEKLELQH